MANHDKITILLADEDALRRDGLAAVLHGAPRFEIVAQCPDGDSALRQIQSLRPDVAVVDLNLPRIHGIELIRRVRAGGTGTRVVVVSGTTDGDIIREVIRAGGDGYLLKNGPARHLIDAISYVFDGGQYFSPQLRRDGLDRHLLQEPPRTPREGDAPPAPSGRSERSSERSGPPRPERSGYAPSNEAAARPEASGRDAHDDPADEFYEPAEDDEDSGYRRSAGVYRGRPPAASRSARPRRPVRRTSDPDAFRERLREEDPNLGDRDYEILTLMADGIRPILERLDDIEGRVVGMETGAEPVPSDVRGWLNHQMADTFAGGVPASRQEMVLGRTVQDLEMRLPQLIEDAVTSRFNQMAGKLQQEIEDTHIRTLETFVKNIQVKLVARVSALETDMTRQAEAMLQLRDSTQRTEDNLGRLISGVDRLAQELPRRLAAVREDEPAGALPEPEEHARRRRHSSSPAWPRIVWAVVGLILLITLVVTITTRLTRKPVGPQGAASAPAADASPAAPRPVADLGSSDTKTKLQAAQEYSDRKDYTTAEDIYKQVLKAEPNNAEAMRALASVLYREDKIEESAAILEKLPKN